MRRSAARQSLTHAENGTDFVVSGTGKPLRQFIYSRDLAKLMVWQLRFYDQIDPLILSVGEADEVSIKQVADAIVKAVGFEGHYSFDTSKADGQCVARSSVHSLTAAGSRRRPRTRS